MLESQNLTKKYGANTAVSDVSLSLEEGHIYGMLGPNGSGKTTWMKMAAGLVKPTTGTVAYNGDPIGINSRKQIAYMSTDPYFYSWMNVGDVGRYYADFFDDFSAAEYDRQLTAMELDKGMKTRTLSTDMAAKLKIAVTLSRDARVYMLDEPFNGIDLLARDAIRSAIVEKSTPDKLLLLSSHLVEELEAIADRAVFLKKGQLVDVCDLAEMHEKTGLSMSDRYRRIYSNQEVTNKC